MEKKTDLKTLRQYEISVVSNGKIHKEVVSGYRVMFDGFEDYEFFVRQYLPFDYWVISEVSTGYAFPSSYDGATCEDAVTIASLILKKIGRKNFEKSFYRAQDRLIKSITGVEHDY